MLPHAMDPATSIPLCCGFSESLQPQQFWSFWCGRAGSGLLLGSSGTAQWSRSSFLTHWSRYDASEYLRAAEALPPLEIGQLTSLLVAVLSFPANDMLSIHV